MVEQQDADLADKSGVTEPPLSLRRRIALRLGSRGRNPQETIAVTPKEAFKAEMVDFQKVLDGLANKPYFIRSFSFLDLVGNLLDDRKNSKPLSILTKNTLVRLAQFEGIHKALFQDSGNSSSIAEARENWWPDESYKGKIDRNEAGDIVDVVQKKDGPNERGSSDYTAFSSLGGFEEDKTVQTEIASLDHEDVSWEIMYRQFRVMVVGRDKIAKSTGDKNYDYTPLPRRSEYSLIVRFGRFQTKVMVPAELIDDEDSSKFIDFMKKKVSKIAHLSPSEIKLLKAFLDPKVNDTVRESNITAFLGKDWSVFRKDEKILEANQRAFDGTERVQDVAVQKARLDPTDFTAADQQICFSDWLDSGTASGVDNDLRFSPFGPRIPETVVIGTKTENGITQILNFARKSAHWDSDGVRQEQEFQAIVNRAIRVCLEKQRIIKNVPQDKRMSLDWGVLGSRKNPNRPAIENGIDCSDNEHTRVVDIEIDGNIIRNALNKEPEKLFDFYKELFEECKVTIHFVLQAAMMMTLQAEHSHFLENDEHNLIPAITPLDDQLAERIEQRPIGELPTVEDLKRFFSFLLLQRFDRNEIRGKTKSKQKGGAVAGMAIMTGRFRNQLAKLGMRLTPKVTELSNKSILFSMVVGSEKPFFEDAVINEDKVLGETTYPSDSKRVSQLSKRKNYYVMRGFTTALFDSHDMGISMIDGRNGAIKVSAKMIKEAEDDFMRRIGAEDQAQVAEVLKSKFNENINKILYFLVQGKTVLQ